MSHLPRGIAPDLLLSQVKNTMPYLFEEGTHLATFPAGEIVLYREKNGTESLSHFEYFQLCVSSHLLTCATPVPTDVDNQIRLKLWPAHLPLETALQMAQFILDCVKWDFSQLSTRFACGASGTQWEREALTGHTGEWFTLSAAAYCALQNYADPLARELRQKLFDQIRDQVHRQSEIFGSLWRAEDGLSCLKTAANIAHNFGDLDRVMDMWELSVADPLRLEFYKLAVVPFDSNRKLRHMGRLWVAGELYKSPIDGSAMAFENHRHFALRKPRCLRLSPELLVPTGPFFDNWGRKIARFFMSKEGAPTEPTFEVVEALKQGWHRLPKTVGYGRALRGIGEIHPELRYDAVSQESFEKKWAEKALEWMDEIPSRA